MRTTRTGYSVFNRLMARCHGQVSNEKFVARLQDAGATLFEGQDADDKGLEELDSHAHRGDLFYYNIWLRGSLVAKCYYVRWYHDSSIDVIVLVPEGAMVMNHEDRVES